MATVIYEEGPATTLWVDDIELPKGEPVSGLSPSQVERLEALRDCRITRAEPSGDPPFEGYDELTADDVVERMDGMAPDELDALKAYEAERKARKTVLEHEPRQNDGSDGSQNES